MAIFLAFHRQRTWAQAELARTLGLTTESVRKKLQEFEKLGVPLVRDDDPPHVYWSVPKGWFPGGLLLEASDVEQVVRLLARCPRSSARDKLIKRVVQGSGKATAGTDSALAGLVSPQITQAEEEFLPVVEDAVSRKTPLCIRYFTAHKGRIEERYVSVHRVIEGTPSRFVAMCHRDKKLKWFRVENITRARLSPETEYLAADETGVEAFLAASIDGYHEGTVEEEHVFVVRETEARWVRQNLLKEMKPEVCAEGLRVRVKTSALTQVARYVLGLGEAVTVETVGLREKVKELAEGALRRQGRTFCQ
jgi:predicted DNA-binding transcriptional regulator YafY